ncbi:MAG: GGDEF domain-containing protein, partial [Actinomycetes bacterium]
GRAMLDRVEIGDHRGVGLLFADVDKLKEINDQHGHDAGDKVLGELAEAIRRALRPGDLAYRWGGDEFIVLCEDVADPVALEGIVKRLGSLAVSYLGNTVVSMSIGSAFVSPGEVANLQNLITSADADMYRRKTGARQ